MKKEIVKAKRISKQAELVKKELAKINKLNKVFNKATPAEKRIIIAKDVIAQIEAGKYLPKAGRYFEPNGCELKGGKELQNVLVTPKFKCNVCELGSMFTSIVRINDNFILGTYGEVESDRISDELTKYFS